MYAGFGWGQKDFIGYGTSITCGHCNNRVVEQAFATYSYEMAAFIKLRHMGERGSMPGDGRILFICPICEYGFAVDGEELLTRNLKIDSGRDAATATSKAIDDRNALMAAAERLRNSNTNSWAKKLNPLKKIGYRKTMGRLGLAELASQMCS